MKELEKCVRSVEWEGLLWGASKLVPVGYGVSKLQVGPTRFCLFYLLHADYSIEQITVVIEDEKVSLDDLQDAVQEFDDYVQSTDIAAMQKL